MASSWTTLDVDQDSMNVYVSTPNDGSNAPGVVVIQHAGGVDTFVCLLYTSPSPRDS